MIPKGIKREYILKAIDLIKSGSVPNKRQSTRHDLIYEGCVYPPKYVVSLACELATGEELSSKVFSGGTETNSYLQELGFYIQHKKDWTERECYFAVWAYDKMDMDRNLVKKSLYEDISNITGRSLKSVEYKDTECIFM